MNVPKEIYEDWQAGLDSGKNNKTARKAAVDKWNWENPEERQYAYGEVGCQVPDGVVDAVEPPDGPPTAWTDRLGDMTKAELVELAKEHNIDVPTSCRNKKKIIEYLSKELCKTAEAGLETREGTDA